MLSHCTEAKPRQTHTEKHATCRLWNLNEPEGPCLTIGALQIAQFVIHDLSYFGSEGGLLAADFAAERALYGSDASRLLMVTVPDARSGTVSALTML